MVVSGGDVSGGVVGSGQARVTAVIGAGIMGSAMARRLLLAGLPVTVWDRSVSARASLAEAGAQAAASAREAVRRRRRRDHDAADRRRGEFSDLRRRRGRRFRSGLRRAQMGTIGVEQTIATRDRLAARRPDVVFVDAPVSGSKGPAEQGQLLILASGPAAAAEPLAPVFVAIGRKTVWLGEAGKGSQLKLVVNAYMSILIEGVAEALELADRLGIGHQQLEEAIAGGPLDAPIADAKLHKMDTG